MSMMGQLAALDGYDPNATFADDNPAQRLANIDPMTGVPMEQAPQDYSRLGGIVKSLVPREFGDALAGRGEPEPETPGQITEGDVFRSDMAARKNALTGAQTALGLFGTMTPMSMFAPRGASAGIFGGKLADTADLAARRRALTMQREGAPPDAILDATGWEKRPDKQWRFEINDRDSAMQPAPFARMRMNEPLPGNRPDVVASDVFDHPELYAAYPEIANMPVRRLPAVDSFGRENNVRGGYAPDQKAFYLRENLSPDEARKVMLHEMQHAVQGVERFAEGGNISNPAVVKRGDQQLDQVISTAEQKFETLKKQMQSEIMASAPDGQLTAPRLKQWKLQNPDLSDEMDRAFVTMTGARMGATRNTARFDAYRALQGETEARNVATRADLIPEQRFLLRPEVTEDVLRSQQWVNRDKKPKTMMGDIAAPPDTRNPMWQHEVGVGNTDPAVSTERSYTRRYAPAFEMGGDVNAGLDAPTNRLIQTVRDPHRMMFPGVYANPREIAAEAARHVVPENPAMQQLWGVSRADLDAMAIGRVGNEAPKGVKTVANPNGSEAASNIMTPRNEARLQDALYEAGRIPGLKHADAWYIMDPVYQRLEQMFGPEEAVQRFRHLNTMMGMASPSSPVLQEIQRGTAAHWLQQQGRWDDVLKQMPLGEPSRGVNFPDDLRYIKSHLHFRNASAEPMDKYLQRGELLSDKPKVPLYVHASGVPETGFQTSAPVGDAHWSRSVGLADTREGPSNVGAAFTRPEYQQLAPWWRDKIAAPLGIESVPAQARMWTAMGPQTGIDSPLGAGKLELFSQQIVKAAKRLNVSPETARDLILSGGAGAGALMLAPKIGDLAAPDRYSN